MRLRDAARDSTRTLYAFKNYDAGPFTTKADAETARDEILIERFGSLDAIEDWEREYIADAFEIIPIDYILWVTDADESFDGFGTLTLETLPRARRGRKLRLVGILPENLQWQTTRYSSGGNVLHAPLAELANLEAFLD